jgi:hypothetical protein
MNDRNRIEIDKIADLQGALAVSIAAPESESQQLMEVARQALPSARISILDSKTIVRSAVDIVLVRLLRGELTPLTTALEAYDELDRPELVIVVGQRHDPAIQALFGLGLRRVIEEQDLRSWLSESGHLLRCMARGRRAERRLQESLHPQGETAWAASRRLPRLFEAEQRFRETYIRAVLGIVGSRREAAALAGVPYRTFCQIVASAGIAVNVVGEQADPGGSALRFSRQARPANRSAC